MPGSMVPKLSVMGRHAHKIPHDEARGQRFRDARNRLGVSQSKAAALSGLTEKTISRWELGHPTDAAAAELLATVYGVSVGWLLTGDNPPDAMPNPYPAWREFLATPQAQAAPEWAVSQLGLLRFESGHEPTLALYLMLLQLTLTGVVPK